MKAIRYVTHALLFASVTLGSITAHSYDFPLRADDLNLTQLVLTGLVVPRKKVLILAQYVILATTNGIT
jgi:hypothetical protein